jgi:hypothetical protein
MCFVVPVTLVLINMVFLILKMSNWTAMVESYTANVV